MEKLVKKFKEFFLNFDLENKNAEDMIIGMEIIMAIMDTVHVEDYEAVKKLISFTRLMSNSVDDLIDEETLNDIYIRKIMPLFEYLQSKYNEEPKTIEETIREFMDETYPSGTYRIAVDTSNALIHELDNSSEATLNLALNNVKQYLVYLYSHQEYVYKGPMESLYKALTRKLCGLTLDDYTSKEILSLINNVDLFISMSHNRNIKESTNKKLENLNKLISDAISQYSD